MIDAFGDALVGPGFDAPHERWFDRFMLNAHAADGAAPSIIIGAGVYPGTSTVDGYVLVTDAVEQRNLRVSTRLRNGRDGGHDGASDGTGVGPLRWRTLEPLRRWALHLGPNPTGLELDVEWIARTAHWFGDVAVGTASAFAHLVQSGRYRGTASLDGVPLDIDGWFGQRDRSRGVRTIQGGQGLHLWFQAQFADRSIGFLLVESREHDRILLEGATLFESGDVIPVVDVRHDLRFTDGLDLIGGTVEVETADAVRRTIAIDATAGGGFMSGAGYGGRHGTPLGLDHVETERFPLDGSVTPRTLDTPLTDRLSRFSSEGETGAGIVEFAHSRSVSYRYRPSL